MKSKEEILQQEAVKKYGETILKGQGSINYVAFNSDDGVLQNAMDEYAKEVALEFVKWKDEYEYANSAALGRTLTTEELYNYYANNIFPEK